jgi:glycosyltransferase involved in cell wall biosynthesis
MYWPGSAIVHTPLNTKAKQTQPNLYQLTREWPPGYGGMERVAHELATAWQQWGKKVSTISLRGRLRAHDADPLPVIYGRQHLASIAIGQILIPMPQYKLLKALISDQPLVVHLPCPTLLCLGIIAWLVHPNRRIWLYWHSFVESDPGPKGWLIGIYQFLALRWAAVGPEYVITTSPQLTKALSDAGVPKQRLRQLPCCISDSTERAAQLIQQQRQEEEVPAAGSSQQPSSFRLLFIGRLDSYKRLDWLIDAFPDSGATALDIVGDGAKRQTFERLAASSRSAASIRFHGRLSEERKLELLRKAQLLVLPADRSNEAFGIVQLEALACGVPALALDHPRSGMAWVGGLGAVMQRNGLPPLRRPEQLAAAIRLFSQNPHCLQAATIAAKERYEQLFSRATWLRQLKEITS